MRSIRLLAPSAALLHGLLVVGLLWPAPTLAQPVEQMLPDEVTGYTLEEVNRRSPAAAQAIYEPADCDFEMMVMLAAGDLAGDLESMLRSRMSSAEAEAGELSVGGKTFTSFVLGSDLVVFRRAEGVLLGAGRDDLGAETDRRTAEAAVVAFLESFGPDRIEGWTPPEGPEADGDRERSLERPPGAGKTTEPAPAPARTEQLCGDTECFLEAAGRCRPAVLPVEIGREVAGEYSVEGSSADGCRISFRFTDNPDPDHVGRELRFRLEREDQIPEGTLREVVRGCLEGDESVVEAHGCEGPLVGGPDGGR